MRNPYGRDSYRLSGSLNYCNKLARFFAANRITVEEYVTSILIWIVHLPVDQWDACFETVCPDVLRAFLKHMRSEVEAQDFMPSPRPFLVDFSNEEMAERIRREMRPVYMHLFDMTRGKLNQIEGTDSAPAS